MTFIFVHSLFRAGSTAFFNAFRQNINVVCYLEPFHEGFADKSSTASWRKIDKYETNTKYFRHPELDRPYFFEYTPPDISEIIESHFHPSFSFKLYFTNDERESRDFIEYLKVLGRARTKLAMFKCCRTIGRLEVLRRAFSEALHIALIRDPISQFESYRINSYFPTTTDEIFFHPRAPKVFQEIWVQRARVLSSLNSHRLELINIESYVKFYAVWLWAKQVAEAHADLVIHVDEFPQNFAMREELQQRLQKMFDLDIDFSGISINKASIGGAQRALIAHVEPYVKGIFDRYGKGELTP
jgi:hypothetical protein